MLNEVASLLLIFLFPVTPYEQECEPDAQEYVGCLQEEEVEHGQRQQLRARDREQRREPAFVEGGGGATHNGPARSREREWGGAEREGRGERKREGMREEREKEQGGKRDRAPPLLTTRRST
jgi:hypothetical protein